MNKRHLLSPGGYEFYQVDAFAVRNLSVTDEGFTHGATYHDFPHLILKGEVWLADLMPAEGIYFIAVVLARLNRAESGTPHAAAYKAGLNVERRPRAAGAQATSTGRAGPEQGDAS